MIELDGELPLKFSICRSVGDVSARDFAWATSFTAVAKRDSEWREYIDENYVLKKVETDLINKIQEKDNEIRNLNAVIKEKDNFISENQSEISEIKASHYFEKEDLKGQITNLYWENKDLIVDNCNMHYYMENRFDKDVRLKQDALWYEKEALDYKIIDYNSCVEKQQSILDELYFDVDKKLKDVERREEKLNEEKDKFSKRVDEFYKKINQLFSLLEERRIAVEMREKNVAELEKILLKRMETDRSQS